MSPEDKDKAFAWLKKQGHDGKKWIYEDAYLKEKEQLFQDGINEVLENPQKYGLEKQGKQDTDISSFSKEQQVFMQKYVSLDKITLIKLLAERDAANAEIIESFEKQSEQTSADKVEPKFKVGDWIINSEGKIRHIIGVDESGYLTDYGWLTHDSYEREFHLWTIQDAKDGDVLCSNQIIILFKQWECNTVNFVIAHAGIDISGKLQITDGHWLISNESKPATQEQRDLLFSKMKEAGYYWEGEDKVLKKINLIKAEHGKYYYCIKDYFSGGKKFASKGDVVQALRGLPIMGLEDISEYFLPVDNIQKSAWSEEDEKILERLIKEKRHSYNTCEEDDDIKDQFEDELDFLLSLKDRMVWRPTEEQKEQELVEQKPSWGNDDEAMFDGVIADIQFTQKAHAHDANQMVYDWEIDWLKSIKEKMKGT